MTMDEYTSNLLDLLQLTNSTVLHFNYEQILFYKLYYWSYYYYIFYDLKNLKKISVEILELGQKTGDTRVSPASPLPTASYHL